MNWVGIFQKLTCGTGLKQPYFVCHLGCQSNYPYQILLVSLASYFFFSSLILISQGKSLRIQGENIYVRHSNLMLEVCMKAIRPIWSATAARVGLSHASCCTGHSAWNAWLAGWEKSACCDFRCRLLLERTFCASALHKASIFTKMEKIHYGIYMPPFNRFNHQATCFFFFF